jgi:hypothetical protein
VGGVSHHPDVQTLVFKPTAVNQLFSGTDGGIHRTVDVNAASVNWVNLNNNYITYQYYHAYLDPLNGSNAIIGGAQDNGTTANGTSLGFSSNTNMFAQFSGDGCACAISRADACIPFYVSSQSGNIRRDCPVGATITPAGSASDFVTYFWLDPINNNNLYYAAEENLYRTKNATNVTTTVGAGATSWQNLGTISGGVEWISTMVTSWGIYNTASSKLFIGSDEGGIYRLNDPANTANLAGMVQITPAAVTKAFPLIVSGLALHPSNANTLIAAYSNYGAASIFLTNNANAAVPTWVNVSRNIEALSVRSVAIVEAGGSTLFVAGTSRGLYTSPDPTTTDWTRVGNTTIGMALVSRLMYRPSDNKLLVGTHGNGMFMVDVLPPLLPVEILRFDGEYADKKVNLIWETASELNNMGFEVLKSYDAINFESIGLVYANGTGTSNFEQQYDFKDKEISKQIQYYRLRQIDFDGTETFSSVIAVKTGFSEELLELTVYPNPVFEKLNINLGKPTTEPILVQLHSVKGELKKELLFPNSQHIIEMELPNNKFPAGMYILRIFEGKNLMGSRKVFKTN